MITHHVHIGSSYFNLPFARMRNHHPSDAHFWLIEPNPDCRDKLRSALIKNGISPAIYTIHPRAISTYTGFINFIAPDFDKVDVNEPVNEWVGGISSVVSSKCTGRTLLDQPFFKGKTKEYKVECQTLDSFVNQMGLSTGFNDTIGSMIIDTEGHDFDIVMSYSFNWRPAFMKIEHKHCTIPQRTVIDRLESVGYEVYSENEDLYAHL